MRTLKNRIKSLIRMVFGRQQAQPPAQVAQLKGEQLEARDLLATLLWLGAEGMGGDLWATASNWLVIVADPGGPAAGNPSDHAPGLNDVAQFTAASTRDCRVAQATTVGGLEVDGYSDQKHITLDQQLTVKGGHLKTTTSNATRYTITGSGNFVIATGSTFTWYRGTMTGSGSMIVSADATLKIESSNTAGSDAQLAGRDLTNNGTIDFTSGQLVCRVDPNVNPPHLPFGITNNGTFNASGTASGILANTPVTFANAGQGKVVIDVGSTSLFRMDPYFSTTSAPAGADPVTVESGQFWLMGGGQSNGRWAIFTGATVLFGDDPVPNSNPPQFVWNTGTHFTGANGYVGVLDTRIRVANAANQSITFDSKLNFRAGTIEGANADSKLVLNNQFIWTGGKTAGTGTIELASAAAGGPSGGGFADIFQGVFGLQPTLVGWTIQNNAIVTVSSVNFVMGAGSALTNQTGGQIVLSSDANVAGMNNAGGTITVGPGAFLKLPNTGTSTIAAPVQFKRNGGQYERGVGSKLIIGTFEDADPPMKNKPNPNNQKSLYTGPGEFDVLPTLGAGGVFTGSSYTTTPTFQNAGTVAPGEGSTPGIVYYEANYTQTAAGGLAIDLGGGAGAVGGADYDQIVVIGASNVVTLAGALNVTALSSLAATVGTVFTLIDNQTDAPVAGIFDSRPEGSIISVGGWQFEISYVGEKSGDLHDNNVILTVVAVPGGTVAGRVWNDVDQDGIQDAGEGGLLGVHISLFDASGNQIATTRPDANGDYTFTGVAPGQYRIVVSFRHWVASPQDQGGNDAIDSDVDGLGQSVLFTLVPNGTADIDAGMWEPL